MLQAPTSSFSHPTGPQIMEIIHLRIAHSYITRSQARLHKPLSRPLSNNELKFNEELILQLDDIVLCRFHKQESLNNWLQKE